MLLHYKYPKGELYSIPLRRSWLHPSNFLSHAVRSIPLWANSCSLIEVDTSKPNHWKGADWPTAVLRHIRNAQH